MHGHLTYFSPLDCKARFWKGSEINEAELKGSMRVEFETEKKCIGYNDGHSTRPCPAHSEGTKQCNLCGMRDISRMYTRLDYSGFESFYENFKNQKFSVYLVSFGHLLKCGVTRTSRLLERVREQGADCFSEIAKTEDAETAYAIESMIQQNFSVRNGLTSAQKMKLIGATPSYERMAEYLGRIKESGMISEYEGEMKLCKLDYNVPASFSESLSIDGNISGNKGQILFFEKDNQHYGINMSKKTGSFFTLG